ncbi:hypothetical protein CVN56_26315 [Rhodococcus sp. AQ5-07]|nr:hypothetical protein CVN56_26315 [Rhodococcus sp. AQ5-07]
MLGTQFAPIFRSQVLATLTVEVSSRYCWVVGIGRRIAAAVVLVCIGSFAVYFMRVESRTLPSLPDAIVTHDVTCEAPNVLGAIMTDPVREVPGIPSAPDAGAVPKDFAAVQVVTCSESTDVEGSDPLVRVVDETVRGGDLSELMAAVSQPSRPKSPFSRRDCNFSLARQPVVWLVDARGNGFRPSIPSDRSCGMPSAAPFAAIYELSVVDHSTYTVQAY